MPTQDRDWLLRQAVARQGWDRALLLCFWALMRGTWFVLRSLWHQHVAGSGRLIIDGALAVAIIVVYFFYPEIMSSIDLLVYVGVVITAVATVRYALFTQHKHKVEKNAASVLSAAMGIRPDQQSVRVRSWSGRHPRKLEASVPPTVSRSDLEGIEELVSQRLIAPAGYTWRFDWDLTEHTLTLTATDAMPEIAYYAEVTGLKQCVWHQFNIALGKLGLVFWDCARLPHLLVAGTTGGGKSVALLTLLLHALRQPRQWTVYAVDLKRVELSYLRDRSGVAQVSTDLASAVDLIATVASIMEDRYEAMEQGGVQYFADLPENPPAVLLVVDELAELVATSGAKNKEAKAEDEQRALCMMNLQSISRVGRAAGVHLVLATQRPDANVVPGGLKVNAEARLAVGRMNPVSSEMILEDRSGAELPGIPGRGLWRTPEGNQEVQVLYADSSDLDYYAPKSE